MSQLLDNANRALAPCVTELCNVKLDLAQWVTEVCICHDRITLPMV